MFSGLWDPHEFSIDESTRLVESGATLASSFELLSENPARAGTALMVFFSTVGGLALAGFGLGLQGENMKAAYGAVIVWAYAGIAVKEADTTLVPWVAAAGAVLVGGLVLATIVGRRAPLADSMIGIERTTGPSEALVSTR